MARELRVVFLMNIPAREKPRCRRGDATGAVRSAMTFTAVFLAISTFLACGAAEEGTDQSGSAFDGLPTTNVKQAEMDRNRALWESKKSIAKDFFDAWVTAPPSSFSAMDWDLDCLDDRKLVGTSAYQPPSSIRDKLIKINAHDWPLPVSEYPATSGDANARDIAFRAASLSDNQRCISTADGKSLTNPRTILLVCRDVRDTAPTRFDQCYVPGP